MKKVNVLSLILFIVISKATILAQPNQVGIIDFYGIISDEKELKKCFPFNINDTVNFLSESAYPIAKKNMMDCLLKQSKVMQADISFVCCDEKEGKWILFVGIDTSSKSIAQIIKTKNIKLPSEIKSSYNSLMNKIMVAVEKGETNEDYSNGHSFLSYLPARQIQEKFTLYADNNFGLLKDVLNHSKHAGEREIAATVISYYYNKAAIINDLLGAVEDPDENVRNNSVRAIGIIANYSQTNPDFKINVPSYPFINMLNSIIWTDRNKSSFVLLSLTQNRDSIILNQLKQQALKPIVEMATWKSNGHAMPGYMLLGRIAGWSDNEIMVGANMDREAMIKKMLNKINN